MPKIARTLSAQQVKSIREAGNHAVGGVPGLYLQLRESGQSHLDFVRSWVLRYSFAGKRRNLGLGSYTGVGLAEARETAREALVLVRRGIDPLIVKQRDRQSLIADAISTKTFRECASEYMAAHLSKHRSLKHQKQWESTLQQYAYPVIGNLNVAEIATPHVLAVLRQETIKGEVKGSLWELKTETAKRLRGRIENILSFAEVAGFREGKNPASWSGHLDTQLPSPSKIMKPLHQPAMAYRDCGMFIQQLRAKNAIGAKALEFLILTGVRSRSVREANWSEIDLEQKIWIVPAEHTKADREHRVPLVKQSLSLLESLPRLAGGLKIFPNSSDGALSDSTLSKLMREMLVNMPGCSGVPHGFRSSFRDWAAEQTNYPEEIRKTATMHAVGDAVQQAYQRTDLLERRRQLMADWANYLDGDL
jgi:integrase